MANLLQRGTRMLARQMLSAVGVPVTYARGGTSVAITAWVGDIPASAELPGTPIRIDVGSRDFLLRAADIGGLGTPADGDTITQTVAGVSRTYVVSPRGDAPAWRPSDSAGVILRVHTRERQS